MRTSASLGRSKIIYLYELCGNSKQIGEDDCGPISPPPPPAQELLVPPPPVEVRGKHRLALILGCSIGGGLALLVGVVYGLYKLVLWLRSRGTIKELCHILALNSFHSFIHSFIQFLTRYCMKQGTSEVYRQPIQEKPPKSGLMLLKQDWQQLKLKSDQELDASSVTTHVSKDLLVL